MIGFYWQGRNSDPSSVKPSNHHQLIISEQCNIVRGERRSPTGYIAIAIEHCIGCIVVVGWEILFLRTREFLN